MGRYVGAIIAVVAVAALAIGLVAYLGNYGQLPTISAASQAPVTSSSLASLKHVSLTLETFPNDPYQDQAFIDKNVTGKKLDGESYPTGPGANPDWVKYWPTTNLVVPAHALVTITILNYDSATPLLNPFYATPQGTVDPATGQTNTMLVTGVDGKQQSLQSQDPTNVSHTFTIHGIPNANHQPWLYVSVPVTAAPPSCDPSQPNVKPPDCVNADDFGMPLTPVATEFSFVTGDPGSYIWQCFDPCGSNFNGFGGPMATKGYMSGTFTVQA
jgi:hypothetical protein